MRLLLLIGLVACMGLLLALVIQIQANVAAWAIGGSQRFRAQQASVYWLERYLDTRDSSDLQAACGALEVLRGDRAVRLALERDPIDWRQFSADLALGRSTDQDMPQRIWLSRYGRHLPYLHEAIELWEQADHDSVRLRRLADRIAVEPETAVQVADVQPIQVQRAQLHLLDKRLRRDAENFMELFTQGAKLLYALASVCIVFIVLSLLIGAAILMRRIGNYLIVHEKRFLAAFQQAKIGMIKCDGHGAVIDVNPAMAKMLHRSSTALREMTLAELIHPEDLLLRMDGKIDWPRQIQPGELRLLLPEGEMQWVHWSTLAAVPGPQRPRLVVALVEDVIRVHEIASEVAFHARHDALTGLINRHEIERRLQELIVMPQLPTLCHVLCFVDLDRFKLVNDTFGHAIGDRFLCHFADVVSLQLRPGDWLGRLGGDEFAILLANADFAQVKMRLEHIHAVLTRPWCYQGGRSLTPSCSFGVVEIRLGAHDVNELMTAADLACCAAKEEGRNRIRCLGEAELALARRRRDGGWIAAVQEAISENRLLLYAQKIKVLEAPERIQYEILVRMRGHDGAVCAPGEFLPAVERYGLVSLLDMHVLEKLCGLLSSASSHLNVLDLCHVNVSAQSIAQPDFFEFVRTLFERYPALVPRLCLEITETAIISDLEHAQRFVEMVRACGCHVALDDFGCGLASFSYLKQFRVDMLKIDSSFVRHYAHDAVDRAAIHAIAQVGLALGIEVVAEGVETEDDIASLREAGVSQVQGYGLHRPCPLEELIRVECAAPVEDIRQGHDPR